MLSHYWKRMSLGSCKFSLKLKYVQTWGWLNLSRICKGTDKNNESQKKQKIQKWEKNHVKQKEKETFKIFFKYWIKKQRNNLQKNRENDQKIRPKMTKNTSF